MIDSSQVNMDTLEHSIPHLRNFIQSSWVFKAMEHGDPQIEEIKLCI